MILLYRGTSPLSRCIRFCNWSCYSHASWTFARIDDDKARLVGDMDEWEAWGGGNGFPAGVGHRAHWGAAHRRGTRVDCFELKQGLTARETVQLRLFFGTQLGKGYDWRGVAHFITRRSTDNPDKWFCSELVFAGLKRVNVTLLERVEQHKVYPGMLAYSPAVRLVGHMFVGAGGVFHE